MNTELSYNGFDEVVLVVLGTRLHNPLSVAVFFVVDSLLILLLLVVTEFDSGAAVLNDDSP